jgi:hypothetical protein
MYTNMTMTASKDTQPGNLPLPTPRVSTSHVSTIVYFFIFFSRGFFSLFSLSHTHTHTLAHSISHSISHSIPFFLSSFPLHIERLGGANATASVSVGAVSLSCLPYRTLGR